MLSQGGHRRGYDEYETAPRDHPDPSQVEALTDTAGPGSGHTHRPAQGDDATAEVDLAEVPF